MKVIGDIENATKFYVINPEKGLLWVPNYETAKQYVNDPKNKNWYQQTVIATHEQIVTASDGKQYVKSQAPKKTFDEQLKDSFENFKEQSQKKIDIELQNFAVERGFRDFITLHSFHTSKLSWAKKIAQEAISYRDEVYKHTQKYLDKFEKDDLKTINDIAFLYDEYLENFPDSSVKKEI